MKKLIAIILFTLSIGSSYAQIGIGTAAPDASAALDVSATNKGFLPPRVANVGAIATPAAGLIIYDVSEQCIKYHNGTDWSGCLSDGTPTAVAGTVDCGSLAVNGAYKPGFVITASETVTLNVDFTVAGAWSASTDLVNGYAFVGSGTVASTGVQPVTLNAMGIPTAAQTDAFTLTFNNPTQTCNFNVTVSACGAYVAAGVYKAFMCHNLGADTNLDPNVPVQGIHGNYYQWGRSTVVADAYTSAGVIGGWNTTSAANGSWTDASKTGNDPCPAGFRVPTRIQWAGVIANNTVSLTGSWTSNSTNFTTAMHWGPDASTKTLTLPATGFRYFTNGELYNRGIDGIYWSSTEVGTNAYYMDFYSSIASAGNYPRTYGFSVRCVSE